MVRNKYQWILHHGCMVDPVDDDINTPVAMPFKFIPISELQTYTQGISTADVLVIALEMLPEREQATRKGPVRVQEIIVIDASLQPIIFTLWNQFIDREGRQLVGLIADRPVIAAMRVSVSYRNGISISTWGTTSMMIAPEIPDAVNLRQWSGANGGLIEELMRSRPYLALAGRLEAEGLDDIVKIADVDTFPDNIELKVKCSLQVVDTKNLYFVACSNCKKSTTAGLMDYFRCISCQVKEVHGIPICRATVKATDKSGELNASILGKDAECLLECDVGIIIKKLTQAKPPPAETFIKTTGEGEKVYTVKGYHTEFNRTVIRKFSISQFKEAKAEGSEDVIFTSQNLLIDDGNERATSVVEVSEQPPPAVGAQDDVVKEGNSVKGKEKNAPPVNQVDDVSLGKSEGAMETVMKKKVFKPEDSDLICPKGVKRKLFSK